MWIPQRYNPLETNLRIARAHLEQMMPVDWDEITGKGQAGQFEPFEPTPLVFKEREPTCFWEWEGGVPFRGQEHWKELIHIKIETLQPEERFKALLAGGAGTGKTALGWIIAKRLFDKRGGDFFEVLATQIATLPEFERFVRSLKPNATVFMDEIHLLAQLLGPEPLLHVLADTGEPRLKIGSTQILVPPSVSWIAATTDPGRMESLTGGALKRRFDPVIRLEAPGVDTLVEILFDQAVPIEQAAAYEIAERSNGLPWSALSMYKDATSVARSEGAGTIGMEHVQRMFRMRKIDPNGLGADAMAVIRALLNSPVTTANGTLKYKMAQGGMCAASGVDPETYRTEVQPNLLRRGLLTTSGGQTLTPKALIEYQHLLE